MANDDISLIAVGDVFVSGVINHTGGRVQDNRRNNPNAVFDLVPPFLRGKDIIFCNLEGPFCKPGRPLQYKRSSWCSEPRNVSALKYAGFNIVSLANNQTMGYGPDGLMETIETLKSNGIAYVGAGENLDEARRPKILSQKNTKIGFLARFTNQYPAGLSLLGYGARENSPGVAQLVVSPLYEPPQVNELDFEQFEEDVRMAKSMSDVLIVGCHMGVQGQALTMHQPAIAHKAIDCGADLVVCTHPHRIQGIEAYKGRLIFYSIGNFALDFNYAQQPKESIILDCVVSNKTIKKIVVRPCLLNQGSERQTKILQEPTKDGERIFAMLDKLSKKLGTTLSYEDGEIKVLVD
ncbi:MAG: CapA family protein [Deltaproteobacteria bacterium]|nr:CapA family protein [Deltaproteobacteria bacterium]